MNQAKIISILKNISCLSSCPKLWRKLFYQQLKGSHAAQQLVEPDASKKSKMRDDNPLAKLDDLFKQMAERDKENPSGPDEETDPRIVALLAEGLRLQQELDPIVRETFKDQPEVLAEWDSIMHLCDDLPEEKSTKSD